MTTRFPWMTGVDRAVLDWLDEYDIVFSPQILHANFEREMLDGEPPSYSQVSRRIRFLTDEVGLLERWRDERGKYVLSELGKRYLEDGLSDEERRVLAGIDAEGGGNDG